MMPRWKAVFLLLPLVLVLTGCAALNQPFEAAEPTVTGAATIPYEAGDCNCFVKGSRTPTPGKAGASLYSGSATPVNWPALKDRWVTFASTGYAFQFEYPAAYQKDPYAFCAAQEIPANDPAAGALERIRVGSRTEITLLPGGGQDLAALAEAYRSAVSGRDAQAQFDSAQEREVDGIPALVIGYRSGGTGRYAETTLFVKEDVLYQIETGTPSACDVSEINLREIDAYLHLLETFRFGEQPAN